MYLKTILFYLLIFFGLEESVKIGISKQIPIPSSTEVPIATTNTTNTTLVSTTLKNIDSVEKDITSPTTASTTTESTSTAKALFQIFPPKKSNVSTPTASEYDDKNVTEVKEIKNSEEISFNRKYFCNCDLLINSCDINCCCDPDCTQGALKAFDCYADPGHPELKPRIEDFQYQHGLPTCKVNDGWLCIFRTNIRIKDDQFMENIPRINVDSFYKWFNPILNNVYDPQMEKSSYYKYNDPIEFYNQETIQVEELLLPFAVRPPNCHIKEPIRYLKAVNRNCLVTNIEELQENKRNLMEFVAKTKLISSPNQKKVIDGEQLIPIELQRCIFPENIKKCDFVTVNDSYILDIEFENTFFDKITIKIVHNFLNPIGMIIVLNEREFSDIDGVKVWQEYEVKFIFKNQTALRKTDFENLQENIRKFSGPLGYLNGAPLLISQYLEELPKNQTDTNVNEVLTYFRTNSIYNDTFSLFKKRNGFCQKNFERDHSIRYGINTYQKCKLHLPHKNLLQKSNNYTRVCIEIQKEIFLHLLGIDFTIIGDNFKLFVSQLGKPENNISKWTKVHIQGFDYRHIGADFNSDLGSFVCRNILIRASFEFQVGRFIVNNIRHQSLVKNVLIDLGQYHDLEFDLSESIEIPISMTAMFYNIKSIKNSSAHINSFQILFIFSNFIAVLSLRVENFLFYFN